MTKCMKRARLKKTPCRLFSPPTPEGNDSFFVFLEKMERQSSNPDCVSLFKLSQDLLRCRCLSSSRRYALQALLSQPALRWPHQVLAILHVLIAADRPITPDLPDWYSVLQLHRLSGDAQLFRKQFERLSHLLNPHVNRFPFSHDAFALIREAWSILSSPNEKALYDHRLAEHSSRTGCGGGDTFWTICPYCHSLFEYHSVYEDCCLRCQNCTKAFQAGMIPSPPKAVEGTDHYFCFGLFPLGFSGSVNVPKNDIVDISDESEDSSGGKEKRNAVGNLDDEKTKEEVLEKGDGRTGENIQTGVLDVEMEKVEEGMMRTGEDGSLTPDVARRSMKKKSVARNTKKLMGTGKKGRRNQNIIFAMGPETPDCKVGGVEDGRAVLVGGLGFEGSGVSIFTGREPNEEDDDIPVGVPISWDGWNGNFKSF